MATAENRYVDIAHIIIHIDSTLNITSQDNAINDFLNRLADSEAISPDDLQLICWVMLIYFCVHHIEYDAQLLPTMFQLEQCLVKANRALQSDQQKLSRMYQFFEVALSRSSEFFYELHKKLDQGYLTQLPNTITSLNLANLHISTINHVAALDFIPTYLTIRKKMEIDKTLIQPQLRQGLEVLQALLPKVVDCVEKTKAVKRAIAGWCLEQNDMFNKLAKLRLLEFETRTIRVDSFFRCIQASWYQITGKAHPPANTAYTAAQLRANFVRICMLNPNYIAYQSGIIQDGISGYPVFFFG